MRLSDGGLQPFCGCLLKSRAWRCGVLTRQKREDPAFYQAKMHSAATGEMWHAECISVFHRKETVTRKRQKPSWPQTARCGILSQEFTRRQRKPNGLPRGCCSLPRTFEGACSVQLTSVERESKASAPVSPLDCE